MLRSGLTSGQADLARNVDQKKSDATREILRFAQDDAGWADAQPLALLTIKFDNQLLVHRQMDVFAFGKRQNFSLVVVAIDL